MLTKFNFFFYKEHINLLQQAKYYVKIKKKVWWIKMSKIVIALGGNALGKNPEEQIKLLEHVAKIIVNLVKEGNKIVLTHGNGPQVGQILLAMDYSKNRKRLCNINNTSFGRPKW